MFYAPTPTYGLIACCVEVIAHRLLCRGHRLLCRAALKTLAELVMGQPTDKSDKTPDKSDNTGQHRTKIGQIGQGRTWFRPK